MIRVQQKIKRLGFTLVELSIIVVIIGILIAGIATGKSLILQGELNSSIKELQSLKAIISSFQTRYDFLPGDVTNATNYWPNATTSNGNGNGFIDSTLALLEDTYVFQHLSLSGMLPGNFFGGIPSGATRFVFGINSFSSKKQPGSYQIGNSNNIYGSTDNALQLGSLTDSVAGYPDGGLFSPQDAANIDNKIDDGLASSGFYRATEGVNVLAGHCTDGNINATAGTVNFVLSSSDNSACRVFLILPN
jgi:type II secretory pathway pseudopilin PulG